MMNKKILTAAVLLGCTTAIYAQADLPSPVTLHFDASDIQQYVSPNSSLTLDYGFRCENGGAGGSVKNLLVPNQQLAIECRGTYSLAVFGYNFMVNPENTSGMLVADYNYLYQDILQAPKKPLCDFNTIQQPGHYNIAFSFEPAYYKPEYANGAQAGYFLDCSITQE